ncbi:chloride channel protein [Mucilaginibacter ginkgonis]|uniref:Chloride channel protein n=1 Tax=Mucilaginibacter ginkgonis TaxID=2682091 RepID=A0A6I4HWA6_9SPHI|nr:chloride channel protein [Mucilaginibacter ginkgonis]QQL50982.1 chloride channel protein [Mucilaginibacter ginkgonis]
MKLFSAIRLILKRIFDRIHNEKLKKNALQAIPFWIASVITGLFAVAYARLFLYAENLTAIIYHFHTWLLFVVTPLCFVIAWWLVNKYSPYARGSGIPQVMAAIELSSPKTNRLVDKLLSWRIIIIKVASSLVMAIGGAIVGREGPTIQISASVYKLIYGVLPDWWPKIAKKNMLVTGAAAGLAAAFNTPLGGIVFAIEELTKTHISFFKTAIFSSVIIAGLTAEAFLGPYLYLGYPKIDHLSAWVFFPVVLVALLGGLAGSGTTKVMLWIFAWKKKFPFKRHQLLYALGVGFVVASIGYFLGKESLGSGKETMVRVLFTHNKYSEWYDAFVRMGGSILSFTSGGAGGVFAPALSAGANIGSTFAGWFTANDADANIMILAGMVAFLTGVTRSPFTSVILVLEMTDRHNLIFHLILAGMVASLASVLIDKHSFYDHLKLQYVTDLIKGEQNKTAIKEGAAPAEPLP